MMWLVALFALIRPFQIIDECTFDHYPRLAETQHFKKGKSII